MPRSSTDDWDTPGGPGGKEELARRRGSPPGAAQALYRRWRAAADELADGRVFKSTVNMAEFSTFRRERNDAGITDEQLAESFKAFIVGVLHGGTSVRHRDLWRAYSAQWARWVGSVPAPPTVPLKDRPREPGWQR